jgi:hypothetical protein
MMSAAEKSRLDELFRREGRDIDLLQRGEASRLDELQRQQGFNIDMMQRGEAGRLDQLQRQYAGDMDIRRLGYDANIDQLLRGQDYQNMLSEIGGDMYSRGLQYDRIATQLGAALGQFTGQLQSQALAGQQNMQNTQNFANMLGNLPFQQMFGGGGGGLPTGTTGSSPAGYWEGGNFIPFNF